MGRNNEDLNNLNSQNFSNSREGNYLPESDTPIKMGRYLLDEPRPPYLRDRQRSQQQTEPTPQIFIQTDEFDEEDEKEPMSNTIENTDRISRRKVSALIGLAVGGGAALSLIGGYELFLSKFLNETFHFNDISEKTRKEKGILSVNRKDIDLSKNFEKTKNEILNKFIELAKNPENLLVHEPYMTKENGEVVEGKRMRISLDMLQEYCTLLKVAFPQLNGEDFKVQNAIDALNEKNQSSEIQENGFTWDIYVFTSNNAKANANRAALNLGGMGYTLKFSEVSQANQEPVLGSPQTEVDMKNTLLTAYGTVIMTQGLNEVLGIPFSSGPDFDPGINGGSFKDLVMSLVLTEAISKKISEIYPDITRTKVKPTEIDIVGSYEKGLVSALVAKNFTRAILVNPLRALQSAFTDFGKNSQIFNKINTSFESLSLSSKNDAAYLVQELFTLTPQQIEEIDSKIIDYGVFLSPMGAVINGLRNWVDSKNLAELKLESSSTDVASTTVPFLKKILSKYF